MKVTSYNDGGRHRTDMPEIKMSGSLFRKGEADWGVMYNGRDETGRHWTVEISHEEALDIIRSAAHASQEMIDKALDIGRTLRAAGLSG